MNTSTEARTRPFKIVSVVLPVSVSADVKATARSSGLSTSRYIRQLVEAGLSAARATNINADETVVIAAE